MEVEGSVSTEVPLKRKLISVPLILDGKFFEIVSSVDKGAVEAVCNACLIKGKSHKESVVRGFYQPNSNFVGHLKKWHKVTYEEYENFKKTNGGKPKCPRQTTLPFTVTKAAICKSAIERVIMNYIVRTMQPISIVDTKHFVDFVKGLNPDAEVLCSKTLRLRLDSEFVQMQSVLKTELRRQKWICCTADIWSTRHRSFMGVTVHWINTYLERKSAILAMKRFQGSHTSERVTEWLVKIFKTYEIQNKVSTVVTDNGSNFVKAFKDYGLEEDLDVDEDEVDLITNIDFDSASTDIKLPAHIRCASHTISLVATTDLKNALEKHKNDSTDRRNKVDFKATMRSAFAKCTAIWNKVGRSVQTAEAVRNVAGKCLSKPVVTRWNSTFDAIDCLINLRDLIEMICDAAQVEKFKSVELEFLEEYRVAMKSVAWALDKLQTEKDFYYGYAAPVLTKTARDLEKIITEKTKFGFASVIAGHLLNGLSNRFKDILTLNVDKAKRELLAAILLPCVKLRWIQDVSRDELKVLFIKEAEKFSLKQKIGMVEVPNEKSSWSDCFIDDDTSPEIGNASDSVELECIKYLQDTSTSITSLEKYPVMKQMFIRYNSSLPSSAPAERLFSYGGLILRPNRSRLSDELFEKLLLLKLEASK